MAFALVKGLICSILIACVGLAGQAQAADAAWDTAKIEQITGLKGTFIEKENVFKVSLPRTDIKASVAGVKANTEMGLTAWSAFTRADGHTMVMGDIVLLEPEVNKVMSAALESGLEVTALHNHFFWDSPKVMFMHIGGMGDEQRLAQAVGRVFGALKEARDHKPAVARAS